MESTNGGQKRVAVLTSGGDAPVMNAAIRAGVRVGCDRGWRMYAVRQGFAGLIAGLTSPLGPREVGGIIQRGGTVPGKCALSRVMTSDGLNAACRTIANYGVDAIIVIAGNGSQVEHWRWPAETCRSWALPRPWK